MTTLITGGTGFVGGAVTEALAKRGENLRALVRRTSKVDRLRALGVELCDGDTVDAASVTAAVKGCDRVYHLAAIYEWWLPDRRDFYRVNVEGTRNVMRAALEAGVEKVVYTSTAVTIGERKGEIGTERTSHRGYFLGDYERAKYMAEATAFEHTNRGLSVVSVNPTGVYGPGDTKQTGQMVMAYLNSKLPGIFDTRVNLVFVDDVVNGHLRAMDVGRSGERYVLAGDENTTMAGILRTIEEIGEGRKKPPLLPLWLTGPMALGYEAAARVTGKAPLVSRDFGRFCRHNSFHMDNTKAKRELGMSFIPLREGMQRTITWYREAGYVAD